jgi:signal peptidase I
MGELTEEQGKDAEPGAFREVVLTVAVALLLAWLVQGYVVKPFKIPSGSMENTLQCGDRVLVNRVSFHLGAPERGDVVVFHPPAASEGGSVDARQVSGAGLRQSGFINRKVTPADSNYIKRIIGMPGDRVEVRKHRVYLNGKLLREPYLHPLPEGAGVDSAGTLPEVTVPADTYLMLGDHRDNSSDSRVFGFVPRSFIIGKAFLVYWPPQRIGGLPTRDPGGGSGSSSSCQDDRAVFGGA